jgi:hypothetical protein
VIFSLVACSGNESTTIEGNTTSTGAKNEETINEDKPALPEDLADLYGGIWRSLLVKAKSSDDNEYGQLIFTEDGTVQYAYLWNKEEMETYEGTYTVIAANDEKPIKITLDLALGWYIYESSDPEVDAGEDVRDNFQGTYSVTREADGALQFTLIDGQALHINEKTKEQTNEYNFEPQFKTVRVDNINDFVDAIGSNTTILLAPGEYLIPKAWDLAPPPGAPYNWTEVFDGMALQISGVENLTIIGEGSEQVKFITDVHYADVLTFKNCSMITIENLSIGHTPLEEFECPGDVLVFLESQNISIKKTGMFGSGRIGLWIEKSSFVTVTDSSIYDCSLRLSTIRESAQVLFERCVLRDSADGFVILNTDVFVMDNCEVKNNGAELDKPEENGIFFVDFDDDYEGSTYEGGVIRNTRFTDNNMGRLTVAYDVIEENNTYKGNGFEDGEYYYAD